MRDEFAPRKPGRPAARKPVTAGSVLTGIALTGFLHLGGFTALWVFWALVMAIGQDDGAIGVTGLFLLGGVQLVWMFPAWVIARRRGRNGIAVGLVIGASVTLLLWTGCVGMLFSSM